MKRLSGKKNNRVISLILLGVVLVSLFSSSAHVFASSGSLLVQSSVMKMGMPKAGECDQASKTAFPIKPCCFEKTELPKSSLPSNNKEEINNFFLLEFGVAENMVLKRDEIIAQAQNLAGVGPPSSDELLSVKKKE